MKTTTTAVTVNEIQMHTYPHADEAVGCALVRLPEGLEKFPGADEAVVRFVEKDATLTDAEFDKAGILPIGCGGEVRFNDHRGPTGRVPGECSATLVAKYIGIDKKPEFMSLLSETLHWDTNRGCPSTCLADLMKATNRKLGNGEGSLLVLNWAMKVIEAIITRERFGYAAVSGEQTLLQLFNRSKKSYKNKTIVERMETEIIRSMSNADRFVTELAYITTALYRRPGYTADDVYESVRFALDSMYDDQVKFHAEVKRIKDGIEPIEVQMLFGRHVRSLKLFAFWSDSHHAQKAARKLGADIVLVRQSSGNAQIFIKSEIRGLNLANVVRMVRWLELSRQEKQKAVWYDLKQPGNYPGVSNWHYFKGGEMFFNGGETHSAEPTKIGIEALVEVLQHAFHPDGVKLWCNRRGITMNPKSRAALIEKPVKGQGEIKTCQTKAGFKNGIDVALKKAKEESAKRKKKK